MINQEEIAHFSLIHIVLFVDVFFRSSSHSVIIDIRIIHRMMSPYTVTNEAFGERN
ncbi:MAG: hypothetical protein KBT75_00485 [Oleispira antarctica]|nr:hypothetical protein [Oleispira antarctica]